MLDNAPLSGADRTVELTLLVPITPKGWSRAGQNALHGRPFTPHNMRRYKDTIRAAAEDAWGKRDPLRGAIALHVRAFFPLPKSVKARRFHTQRPDGDNCYKAVADALMPWRVKRKGVWVQKWPGVYIDDAHIVDGRFWKELVPSDEPGQISIRVWSLR